MTLTLFICSFFSRFGSEHRITPFQLTISNTDFEVTLFLYSTENYGVKPDVNRALFRFAYARQFGWAWMHLLFRIFSFKVWREESEDLPF